MLYLLLFIILSSTVTLMFKVTGKLGLNDDNLIVVNYLVASTVSIITSVRAGIYSDFFSKLAQADAGTVFTQKTVGNSYLLLLTLGLVQGVFYIYTLFNTRNSVKYNGAGISTLFHQAGFILTMTIAMLIWKEIPTALQIIGIVLAVIALITAYEKPSEKSIIKKPSLLVIAFTSTAAMAIINKTSVYYALEELRPLLISTLFPTALICGIGYLIIKHVKEHKKFRITGKEILFGILLGTPNVLSSYVQLRALAAVPSNIFYPTSAAGSLVTVTLVSALIFKEALSKKQKISIAILVVSLILVNI